MYNSTTVRYIIPVNDMGEGSQTVKIITITGSCTERRSLLAKYLRFEFSVTRKIAHAFITALGFTDLIPA